MGSTPKDDEILLLNPRHVLSVKEQRDNSNRREVVCFVKMAGGEGFTVRNSAEYILRVANQ
jgi:hypothetical protein